MGVGQNFKDYFRVYFRGDKVIWALFIALIIISVLEVFSATSSMVYNSIGRGNYSGPISGHAFHCFIGFACAFFIHMVDVRKLWKVALLGYFVFLLYLAFTWLSGASVNSASRWQNIGGMSVQPSEFVKFFTVIVVALLLSKLQHDDSRRDARYSIAAILAALVPVTIIFFDNVSTAILLGFTSLLMYIIGKMKWKYIFATGAIGLTAITAIFLASGTSWWPEKSVFKRATTMRNRIIRHIDNDEEKTSKFEITDENFQSIHGKIAISNCRRGGTFGITGLGPGRSIERDTLPQAYSDFIYAIIIEEWGMVGCIGIILIYLILLWRIGKIMANATSTFSTILIAGLGLLICLQAMINTSVAVGLIPVTGQPLPFISRGGSAYIMMSAYIGVILSISRFETPALFGEKGKENQGKKEKKQEPAPPKEKNTLADSILGA